MADTCPNCGFNYAWDGLACGHCHFPDAKAFNRDEWAENRILRFAREYRLPNETIHFVSELNHELRATFTDLLQQGQAHEAGRPVIIYVGPDRRWTLVGTRKFVSSHSGDVQDIAIDEVAAIQPSFEPHPVPSRQREYQNWKEVRWEFLQLTDRSEKHAVVWVPTGNGAFSVLKILRVFSPQASFDGTS